MALPELVLVIAVLLAIVSLAEPLAQRLHLPASVILALIGLVIGATATVLAHSAGGLSAWGEAIGELPINSQVFLFIFLPALLFHGALNVDVRDMAGDAAPILTMAIVAVLVSTFAIGLALWPLSGVSLVACLLVGAIVATTDPSAVIAIFRDLGAPQRLARLVEGESLLNDAVAITLFVVLLDLLAAGHAVRLGTTALQVVVVPLGGALLGLVAGWLFARLFALGGDNRLVHVSLTLALPYLVFVLAETWHLSGPIAVVAAGLTLSAAGPARISPSAWRYLKDVWDQIAFWAGSLVFILAAILVPRLIGAFGWPELVLLGVVIGVALAARGAVLFGLMPALAALKMSPPISDAFKTVILWGGLRGAVTLALALAVTENPAVGAEVERFVAVLATGFVLFTLLVQGTTLRPLMRALGLDRLSPLDSLLRDQAVSWSQSEVRKAIEATAADYSLPPRVAAEVAGGYALEHKEFAASDNAMGEVSGVALGLAALAAREQDLVLNHLEDGTASPGLVGLLLARARLLLEAARLDGAEGYQREAAAGLKFSRRTHLAARLHSRLGIDRYLERELATRCEMLLVSRIVINGLLQFSDGQLAALLGPRIGAAARDALELRLAATARSLDALRLQYPDYAERLMRRFLLLSALRRERIGYERLHAEGLIGPEVLRELTRDVAERAGREQRPRLDLKLDTGALVSAVPLFHDLGEAQRAAIARLMRPAFAIPGQRLIVKGERGDSAWFIASGAVEVDTGREQIRLGRGDFFGELALLTGLRRQADVTAIAYSELLVLYARDFQTLLDGNAEIRAAVESVAAERLAGDRDPPRGRACG